MTPPERDETSNLTAAVAEDSLVLPLVEEQLHVGKRAVLTGRVRVTTVTETREEQVRQELHGEQVEVERVPVDRFVEPGAPAPQARTEGDVTVIPVLEEVLVVEKRLRIVEEVRLTRRRTSEVVETPVTLRKQSAVVERDPVGEAETSTFDPSRKE